MTEKTGRQAETEAHVKSSVQIEAERNVKQ